MDMMLSFDAAMMAGDIALTDVDIATDTGLQTAVVVSLFTDRRAEDDDELPAGEKDRRGWWGDMLADQDGDKIGSRLWLLSREKQLPEIVARAEEYAAESLQWLLDDDVAKRVQVAAHCPRRGWLCLQIGITRVDGTQFEDRFSYPLGAA